MATYIPNRGNTELVWSGSWAGQTLKEKYPQLFSYSTKPKFSIQFFLEQEPDRVFRLPLSPQATAQLEEVQNILLERIGDENLNDKWTYS
jgi:hypothetical protein